MVDPVDPKHVRWMNDFARRLDMMLNSTRRPRKWGFALLIFDMGAEGRVNYVSNAARPEMLTAMKEFIARNEGRYVEPGEAPSGEERSN